MKAEAVVPKAIAFPTPLQSQVEIQGHISFVAKILLECTVP